MDDYYQNYADNTSYFQLNDFIIRVGNIAADFYRQEWRRQYDEFRQEKRDETVSFDPTVLAEQIIEVKRVNNEFVGELKAKAMTVPFDLQTTGFQYFFDNKNGDELERSNIGETWTYKYLPYSCRKFARIDGNKVKIFTNAIGGIQEVRVLYVPSIQVGDVDAEIPDGMVEYVIANTVGYMRSQAQGKIIKKSLDNNLNMAFETEMNPKATERP